jgi:hypothetical protein
MNTRRRERGAAASVLLCFLLSLGMLLGPARMAQAQEGTTGTVSGDLTDASGGVLPGVSVVFTNQVNQRVHTVQTDGSGAYRIELPPGQYSVRFELSGFARQETPNFEVQLGRIYDLDASLKVGNVTEAVQVTAENAPLVDTRSTIIAHNVTAEEIDRLPKGRSFQSIALTAPSVNSGEIEGGFQVNGASGAENAFTVDGVVTNSLINGSSRQNTVFEYIQEVQVKTTGIPAEYGGALGGVISAVTKSGGNIFTGETHYYIDGSPLSAGPVKRLVMSPVDDISVQYWQDEKQSDVRQEFGGSIGGPIVRDKLFFFGSFSPRIAVRDNMYRFSNGAEQGNIERTQKLVQAFGKVSAGSRRVNAYVSSLITPSYISGTLPAYDGFGANYRSSSLASNEPSKERGWEQMQANVNGNVDVVISNGAYATFRGGYFHDRYTDTGIPQTTNYTYQTATSNCATIGCTVPANLAGPVLTQNTPRAQITNFDTTKRALFNADYNHTFQSMGWHTLKGGFGVQHTLNDVNSTYPGGYVDIFWGSTLALAGQPNDRGAYGYYAVNDRGVFGKAGANILSLYVQDQWQIHDRLTLNIGLRTENENVPAYKTEVQDNVFEFGWKEKLAPRLGFSYDVTGTGRGKVYASYGRYYDWTKYEMPRGSFGGDIWCIKYRAIDNPNDPVVANWTNAPGRDLWQGGGDCRDRRVPSFETVDDNAKPMSQDSYSAGFDFEVNPRTVATIHFVHNNLNRTIEDLGALVNGNEAYLLGNPGEGTTTLMPASAAPLTGGGSFPMPKAKRQYDAVEVGVSRRFSNSWFGSANLTISRLYGNYAGIASSDEIRTPTLNVGSATAQQQAASIFREGGNVNRGWDLDDAMFDSHGNLDVLGRLATDRPVVAKFYGGYNWRNTQIGAFVYAGSGTPMTTYVNSVNQTEIFVEGRGNMGRTPMFNKTDLLLSHELAMAGSKRIRLELNVLNLFNQKTSRHVFNYLNRGGGTPRASSGINLAPFDLYKGYDYNALIRGTADGANAYDPRYGMDDLFEAGTQGQISVKFLF